jgi:TRAP-type C4-dicarboxylate transport system substrate-binding protein
MCINNTALNALPENLKKIVLDTQNDFKTQLFKNIAVATEESRAGLLKGGMKEIKWPKADLDKLAQLSDAINLDYYKASTPAIQKLYDKLKDYIAKNPAGS